jgi:hypothetical protein
MLGPALTLLFDALDSRQNSQTVYEQHLYQELLVLKLAAEKFAEAGLGGMALGLPAAVEGGTVLIAGKPFDPGMKNIIVGPLDEGAGEAVRMQINCGKTDCPNKEYK